MRIFPLVLLSLSGCSFINQPTPSASVSTAIPETCPEKPTGFLPSSKVKTIALSGQDKQESGVVKAGESMGFSFEAKGNEKLNYTTKDNLCIWVFSPENQIIKGTQLTQKGNHTVQVSVPAGTASFNLAMRLDLPQKATPSPQPSVTTSSSSQTQRLSTSKVQESTERVSFSKGSTKSIIQDTISPSQLKHYLLQCFSGQLMKIRSQSGAVNIRVIDPNGSVIGNLSSGDSNWQGNLPSSGDYSLDIRSSNDVSIQVEIL